MSTKVTGVVEEIHIEDGYRRPMNHATEVAQVVRATLRLEDGRRAYVQTSIGAMTYYAPGVIGPIGAEHFHSSTTDDISRVAADGRWPWALDSGVVIAVPTKGSPFEGTTAYPYSRPVLAVWEGDKVTVSGTVKQITSKKGNDYLVINRAVVTSLERPADSHRYPGMPEGRGERLNRLRQEFEAATDAVEAAWDVRSSVEMRDLINTARAARAAYDEARGVRQEAA